MPVFGHAHWGNPKLSLRMNSYEIMVIFTPVLSEEEFQASQQKYKELVVDAGGEITHSNPWGLKVLAYQIDKKTTGLYWVCEFESEAPFIEKLTVALLRDDHVLRHVITRLDKHSIHYNYVKRNGGFKRQTPDYDEKQVPETVNPEKF